MSLVVERFNDFDIDDSFLFHQKDYNEKQNVWIDRCDKRQMKRNMRLDKLVMKITNHCTKIWSNSKNHRSGRI